MATIGLDGATVGKYYELVGYNGKALASPQFLGKYLGMRPVDKTQYLRELTIVTPPNLEGRARYGKARLIGEKMPPNTIATYVFTGRTIPGDTLLGEQIREVEKRGGRRRKSRHRKSRRSRKTARK